MKVKKSEQYNFIADTKTQFQRFSETALSVADVEEIEHNLLGMMKLLLEWQNEEEEGGGGGGGDD